MRVRLLGLIWILINFSFASTFAQSDKEISPYQGAPGWSDTKDERMEWFRDARFGMFIHWGLYSAAGGYWAGEKYPQDYAEWIQTWAKVPSRAYADSLRPKFTASKFDAGAWADLAEKAGMKYVIITSRHHEGFTIFNSRQPYALNNGVTGSTNISPEGRDLYGELIHAFKERGLKAGAYYSLLDWQHPDSYEGFRFNPNPDDYVPDHDAYRDYLYGQIKELATNYDGLDVLWADFSSAGKQGETWGTRRILTDLIKWQPDILVNNRFWDGLENKNGDFGTPEKYVPPTGLPGMDWEVSHTMNESYGYSRHDSNWKSYTEVMRLFLETVSKGGNFLLNVGPDGQGEIPQPAIRLLEDIGAWMDINSEAIYQTQASPFQYMDWGYCTQKPGMLYLTVFNLPEEGKLSLPLKTPINKAYTLADQHVSLQVDKKGKYQVITLPGDIPGPVPVVVAVEIQGAAEVFETPVNSDADGRIILEANSARLSVGLSLIGANTHDPNRPNAIGRWKNTKESAHWEVRIRRPGNYRIVVHYKSEPDRGGSIQISLGDSRQAFSFPQEDTSGFKSEEAGILRVQQSALGAAPLRIGIKADSIRGALPQISRIELIPVP